MKTGSSRRKSGPSAVKRAISLPSDVDDKIATLSHDAGKSYSSVVREAVVYFFKRYEDIQMEKAYQSYYESPSRKAESEHLAEDLLNFSAATWTDHKEEPADAGKKRRGRVA